ncbi:MAG: NAD(+) synthase [Acidobacteriota bacterium]
MKNEESRAFDRTALHIEPEAEVNRIAARLRQQVHRDLRRKGAVVGISGGVDSSVVLGLCVRALGAERVVGLILPEDDSSPESARLAKTVAEQFGVRFITENITAALEGFDCYRRRNEAISRLFPEFGPGWKTKITIPGDLLQEGTLNVFQLTAISPEGQVLSRRMPPREYAQIVAASNFKQRARMTMLYYHAELRHFAVVGTANKNEHALGFFVKHGDGGVDIQPIGHLFKSQVYELARHLNLPADICGRTPTTDTYSAGSSQEEFFFRVPFQILDLVWLGYERGISSEEIGSALDLSAEQVDRVVADILRKHRTTAYLRTPAMFDAVSAD